MDLVPNGNPFLAKLIAKEQFQSEFDLIQQDSEIIIVSLTLQHKCMVFKKIYSVGWDTNQKSITKFEIYRDSEIDTPAHVTHVHILLQEHYHIESFKGGAFMIEDLYIYISI